MPQILVGIAGSLGDTVTQDSSTPGGYTAQQHSTDPNTLNKIAQGNWDYVSLQFQSQRSAFSPAYVASNVYPFAKKLDSIIQATNSCAETTFFMTWGRKNGDAANCVNFPNVCTYNGMQQRLRESYLLYADSTNASVSPVGAAWKKMRDTYPSIDLYDADESHPSLHGSYLIACVFYCTAFKKSCENAPYTLGGISGPDALKMRQIASSVVLDSLENWQGKGKIPDASFTLSINQNQVTFTNTSKRYQSSVWNFGDGTPLNYNQSPFHIFPTTTGGTFNVCLRTISDCGKSDSTCQSIVLFPNTTSTFLSSEEIEIIQNQEYLQFINKFDECFVSILDMNGRKIKQVVLPNGVSKLAKNDFAQGIYFIQIKRKDQVIRLQKFYNF